jgi:hypothetical protein
MRQQLAVVLALAFSAPSAMADTDFPNPRIENRPVDWCLVPTKQCGKPAADRFCQMRQFRQATHFQGERSNEPTYILGTNQICTQRDFDHCDRFSLIRCESQQAAVRHCVVYEHRDFSGASLQIGDRPVSFGTGTEGISTWNSVAGWNDRISSMKFPQGCQMITWEHEFGRGRSRVWTLGNVRYVGDDWNDRISSVECRC